VGDGLRRFGPTQAGFHVDWRWPSAAHLSYGQTSSNWRRTTAELAVSLWLLLLPLHEFLQ